MTYDTSQSTKTYRDPPIWPYTLDFGVTQVNFLLCLIWLLFVTVIFYRNVTPHVSPTLTLACGKCPSYNSKRQMVATAEWLTLAHRKLNYILPLKNLVYKSSNFNIHADRTMRKESLITSYPTFCATMLLAHPSASTLIPTGSVITHTHSTVTSNSFNTWAPYPMSTLLPLAR